MSDGQTVAPPSLVFRYGVPGLVLAAAVALSFFARAQPHGDSLGLLPTRLALWMLPGVSLLVFVGIRLSSGVTDRNSDLLLSWVASFPSMLHVLHLLFGLGVLGRLDVAVAVLGGVLYLGVAALVVQLPSGSPYGLRLPGTLASAEVWRRAHLRLGQGFVIAAALAASTIWLPPKVDLWVLLLGPVLAVFMGFWAGLFSRAEDSAPLDRPSPGTDNPPEDQSSP